MTTVTFPDRWGSSGFAVVVPARNEAARLPRLLASCARDGVVRDVMVVANGCSDDTADLARDWPGRLRVAVVETPALLGGVGEARRTGADLAATRLPANGIIATTDADCELGPSWGGRTLAALTEADAVCGRVVPDIDEFRLLSPLVRQHGRLEDHLAAVRATQRTGLAVAGSGGAPLHGQSCGASLAFRSWAYNAAGGFDPVPCHEDALIVARMERMGLRVARPAMVCVFASCRLIGRAPGGMASTISRRLESALALREEIAMFTEELRGRLS